MYCNECGKPNPDDSNFCQHCGKKIKLYEIKNKESKTEEMHQAGENDVIVDQDIPPYPYIISIRKLVVLSISTIGIYMVYWFYKQFKSFKVETKWKIRPLIRAIFADILAYSLFRRVSDAVERYDKTKRLKSAILAVLFLLLGCLGFLQNTWLWLFGFLSILPLIPVQNSINFYWKKKYGDSVKVSKFGIVNIIWSIIGSISLALIIYTTPGLDSNNSFFKNFEASTDADSNQVYSRPELTGENLMLAINKERRKNNLDDLKKNAWVCEVVKVRLDDIDRVGIKSFDSSAALQRAADKVSDKFAKAPPVNKDIEPEYYTEIYTYQESAEKSVKIWAEYIENDFLTSNIYEYGCAEVKDGYGVFVGGYVESKIDSLKEETDYTNATFL